MGFSMTDVTRRTFIAGAAMATTAASYAQIRGANDRLRIGIVGCGGQARDHMRNLVRMREPDNIDILNVCDIYTKRAEAAAELTGGEKGPDYPANFHKKEDG